MSIISASQFYVAHSTKINLNVVSKMTGEKLSLWSIPGICTYPCATSLVLNTPFFFTLKTHLVLNNRLSKGSFCFDVTFHTLFFPYFQITFEWPLSICLLSMDSCYSMPSQIFSVLQNFHLSLKQVKYLSCHLS